jgi:ABC-type sugar transport system permease subunit
MILLILASTWRALAVCHTATVSRNPNRLKEVIESSKIDGANGWQVSVITDPLDTAHSRW